MRRSSNPNQNSTYSSTSMVDSHSMGDQKPSQEVIKKTKPKSGYFTDDEASLIVKHGLMTSGDLRYRGLLNSVYSTLKSKGFKNSAYNVMHLKNVLNEIDNALSDGEPIENAADASDDSDSFSMHEQKESIISKSTFYGNHEMINSFLASYGNGVKVETDFTHYFNKDSVIGKVNHVFTQIAPGIALSNLGLNSVELLYFMFVAISHKNYQGQSNTFQYVRHHVYDISKSVVNVTSSILSVGKIFQWWGLGLLGPAGVAIVTVSAILINSLISIVEITNEMIKLRSLFSKKNLELPLRLSIQKRLGFLKHKRDINIGFTVVAIAAVVLATINPVGPIVAGILVLTAAVAKYYLKSYYYPKKEVLASTDKEGLLIDRTLVYLHQNINKFQSKIDSLEERIEVLESGGGESDKVNRYKKRLSLYRLKLEKFSFSKGNLKKLNQKKGRLKLSFDPSLDGWGSQLLEELNAIEMASKIRTTSSTRTPKSANAFQAVLWPFKKVFFNELYQSADTKKVFLTKVIKALDLKQHNLMEVHASFNHGGTKLDNELNFTKQLLADCRKLLSRREANKISTKKNNHPQSIIFDKDLSNIMNDLRSHYASKISRANVNADVGEVKDQGVGNRRITENLLFSYEKNFDPKRKFLKKVIKECKIMISALGQTKHRNNQSSKESGECNEEVIYAEIIDRAKKLIVFKDGADLWLKGNDDDKWGEFNSQFSDLIRTMTDASYTNGNDRSSIENLLLHYDKLFPNDRNSSTGPAVGSVRLGASSLERRFFSSKSSGGTDNDLSEHLIAPAFKK